jgi:hypothetical protein
MMIIPPTSYTDSFEIAAYAMLWSEVGPHWETTTQYSPANPDVAAGLCSTTQQRTYAECLDLHFQHVWLGLQLDTLPTSLAVICFDQAVLFGIEILAKRIANVETEYGSLADQTTIDQQLEIISPLSEEIRKFINDTAPDSNLARAHLRAGWLARLDTVTNFAATQVQ